MLAPELIDYSTPGRKYHAAQSLAKTQVPNSPWSPWSSSSVDVGASSLLPPTSSLLPTPLAVRPAYPHCEGELMHFLCETGEAGEMTSAYLQEHSIHIIPKSAKEYIHCPYRGLEVSLSPLREGSSSAQVVCVLAHGSLKTTAHISQGAGAAAGSACATRTTLKLACSSVLKCFLYDAASFQMRGPPLTIDVPRMICLRKSSLRGLVEQQGLQFTITVTLLAADDAGRMKQQPFPGYDRRPGDLPSPVVLHAPPSPAAVANSLTQASLPRLQLSGKIETIHESILEAPEMTPTASARHSAAEPRTFESKKFVISAGEIVDSVSGFIDRETICGLDIMLSKNDDGQPALVEATVNSSFFIDVPWGQQCAIIRFYKRLDGIDHLAFLATMDLTHNSDSQLVPLYTVDNRLTPLLFYVTTDLVDDEDLETVLAVANLAVDDDDDDEDDTGEDDEDDDDESSPQTSSAKRAERNRRRNRKRRLRRKASRAAAKERSYYS